jgi:hypothetical protein
MSEDTTPNEARPAGPRKPYVTPRIAEEAEFEAFSLVCTVPAPDAIQSCVGFLSC